MTSAASEGPKEPGWLGRSVKWLSHFDVELVVAAAVLTVPAALVEPGAWNGFGWALSAAMVVMVIAILGGRVHDEHFFCSRCSERFPLDASREAEQKRWALREVHRSRGVVLGTLAVFYIVLVGSPFLLPHPFKSMTVMPLLLWAGYRGYCRRQHSTLQPWCPWCRKRDKDDDPIVVPEPTPPSAKVDA